MINITFPRQQALIDFYPCADDSDRKEIDVQLIGGHSMIYLFDK